MVSALHKSSYHVQMKAEKMIFHNVECILHMKLEKNKKLYLADNVFTYIQPYFYSEEESIIGKIFAHICKPKKAQISFIGKYPSVWY